MINKKKLYISGNLLHYLTVIGQGFTVTGDLNIDMLDVKSLVASKRGSHLLDDC